MSQIKLTIATVVFNDASGLARTIESVRHQKKRCGNIEFIVADGGSEKPTLDVIESASDVIDNYLPGPDGGIYDGMNRLLAAGNGDSIIFINSGDAIYRDLDLSSLIEHYDLQNKNYYGKVIQRYNNDCYLRPKSAPSSIRIRDISHQAFFASKKAYKTVGYRLDYPVSADRLWIKECLNKADTEYIDEIVSVFELGGTSNISNLKSLLSKQQEDTPVGRKILQFVKYLLKLIWVDSPLQLDS